MKELVLLKNDEVFTTSEIIATGTGVSYRSVQKLIEKYYSDISDFGQVRSEITPVKYDRGTMIRKYIYLMKNKRPFSFP